MIEASLLGSGRQSDQSPMDQRTVAVIFDLPPLPLLALRFWPTTACAPLTVTCWTLPPVRSCEPELMDALPQAWLPAIAQRATMTCAGLSRWPLVHI